LPLQHPIGHETESQIQVPPEQCCPAAHIVAPPQAHTPASHRSARIWSQETQAEPDMPHVFKAGAMQRLAALQHPDGHEVPSQTQPLWVQCCWFSKQAGALPHRQFPAEEQLLAS
jgi:hypothetical protein